MIKTNDPNLGGLLSVHNLILNIKFINYVKLIIDSPAKLKEFVLYNFEKKLAQKILTAFEMIDMSVDKGPEYALHYFRDEMQRNKETTQQKGIFNF